MQPKTLTCPNCSLANDFLAERCIQCGIHFSKYFRELEKAEILRREVEEQERLGGWGRLETPSQGLERTRPTPGQGRGDRGQPLRPAASEPPAHPRARQTGEWPGAPRPGPAHGDGSRRNRRQTVETPHPTAGDRGAAARTIPGIAAAYVGRTIGMAFDGGGVEPVRLTAVFRDHLQVRLTLPNLTLSIPFRQLILIAEGHRGIASETPETGNVLPLVIQVPKPFCR